MKKIISIVLAVLMISAMCISASAYVYDAQNKSLVRHTNENETAKDNVCVSTILYDDYVSKDDILAFGVSLKADYEGDRAKSIKAAKVTLSYPDVLQVYKVRTPFGDSDENAVINDYKIDKQARTITVEWSGKNAADISYDNYDIPNFVSVYFTVTGDEPGEYGFDIAKPVYGDMIGGDGDPVNAVLDTYMQKDFTVGRKWDPYNSCWCETSETVYKDEIKSAGNTVKVNNDDIKAGKITLPSGTVEAEFTGYIINPENSANFFYRRNGGLAIFEDTAVAGGESFTAEPGDDAYTLAGDSFVSGFNVKAALKEGTQRIDVYAAYGELNEAAYYDEEGLGKGLSAEYGGEIIWSCEVTVGSATEIEEAALTCAEDSDVIVSFSMGWNIYYGRSVDMELTDDHLDPHLIYNTIMLVNGKVINAEAGMTLVNFSFDMIDGPMKFKIILDPTINLTYDFGKEGVENYTDVVPYNKAFAVPYIEYQGDRVIGWRLQDNGKVLTSDTIYLYLTEGSEYDNDFTLQSVWASGIKDGEYFTSGSAEFDVKNPEIFKPGTGINIYIWDNEYPKYYLPKDIRYTNAMVYFAEAYYAGESLQPDGKLTVEIKIPDSLSINNLRLVHSSGYSRWWEDEEAVIDDIPITVDRKNRTVTAELSQLGNIVMYNPRLELGDSNGDGSVNNKDVVVLFRLASDNYNDYDASNDLNGDGVVNNKDVVLLFRKVSES